MHVTRGADENTRRERIRTNLRQIAGAYYVAAEDLGLDDPFGRWCLQHSQRIDDWADGEWSEDYLLQAERELD